MKKFQEAYDYYKAREIHLGKQEKNQLKELTKLNNLYTELEFEEDKDTIKKIKKEIKTIEMKLEEER